MAELHVGDRVVVIHAGREGENGMRGIIVHEGPLPEECWVHFDGTGESQNSWMHKGQLCREDEYLGEFDEEQEIQREQAIVESWVKKSRWF